MINKKCIDTHTHTQFWNLEHFRKLDKETYIISLDSFIKIPDSVKLGGKNKNVTYAYGLQPYTEYNIIELKNYLSNLDEKCKLGKIPMLGELGLEKSNNKEFILLEEQVKIAKNYKLPIIIHTPTKNKIEVSKRIYEFLTTQEIPPQRAIIDHINQEILDWHKPEYFLGITIQQEYGKLSEDQAIQLILKNPQFINQFVINSDYSNLPLRKQNLVDINTVKNFKKKLSKIDENLAEKVCYENPLKFLGDAYGN